LGEYHKIVEKSITGGDDKSGIMQYMNTFNLSATAAEQVYNFIKGGKWKEAVDKIEDPDSRAVDETPEGKLLSATEEIRGNIAKWGSDITPLKASIVNGLARLTNVMGGSKALESYKKGVGEELFSLGLGIHEFTQLDDLYKSVYSRSDKQPDKDNNAIGDYADSATRAQLAMMNMSPDQKLRIGSDPAMIEKFMSFFGKEEDFTETNVDNFIKYIESVQEFKNMSISSARGIGLGKEFGESLNRGDPYAGALAESIKERYGSFSEFHRYGGEEKRYIEDFIRFNGKDGLSEEEMKEMAAGAVRVYRNSILEAPRTNSLFGIMPDQEARYSHEYGSKLPGILSSGEISYKTMQEAIKKANELGESGDSLSINELKIVIQELINALSNNTKETALNTAKDEITTVVLDGL
jgi:hypothetical protein